MKKKEALAIVRALVGFVSEELFDTISTKVEMYLSPDLSIFVPFLGSCDYAITPRHTHPGYSFIYNYGGPSAVRVHDLLKSSPYKGKPNICAFSPDIAHEEIVEDQFRSYMAVCISKKFYEEQLGHYPGLTPPSFQGDFFPANDMVFNALKRFMIECAEVLPCRETLLQALALEITHGLIRHCHGVQSEGSRISRRIEINRLINYLNEGFGEKITVSEMAHFVNLSPSHFARVFKEETGASPSDFLIALRIQKAKKYLIDHQCSITDIALNCGFSSSAHFAMCFNDRMGLTPTDYRKKQTLA